LSGIYLYCIAPARHEPRRGLIGIGDGEVIGLEIEGLTAWVSSAEQTPAVALDAIRAHNTVVEASNTDVITTLPVRFGQWLPSEDALRDKLAEGRPGFETQLAHVAGALEFGVRVTLAHTPERGSEPQPPTPEGLSGREYMELLARRAAAKRSQERRGEELAAELRTETRPLAERIDMLEPSAGLVSIAHLVKRSDFTAYNAAVRAVAARHSDVRIQLSGPWPPYSFAG